MGSERPNEDEALVARATEGSYEAFEALVARYQDRIYGVIHRLVGDPERARDLCQETFLRAWRGLGGFSGRSG